jgi:hypothetical protein
VDETYIRVKGKWVYLYRAVDSSGKGQACWSAAGAKVGLLHRFILGLFAAT